MHVTLQLRDDFLILESFGALHHLFKSSKTHVGSSISQALETLVQLDEMREVMTKCQYLTSPE